MNNNVKIIVVAWIAFCLGILTSAVVAVIVLR